MTASLPSGRFLTTTRATASTAAVYGATKSFSSCGIELREEEAETRRDESKQHGQLQSGSQGLAILAKVREIQESGLERPQRQLELTPANFFSVESNTAPAEDATPDFAAVWSLYGQHDRTQREQNRTRNSQSSMPRTRNHSQL